MRHFHGKKIMPSQQNNYRVSGLFFMEQPNPNKDTMAWKPIPLKAYEHIKSSCNSDTKLVAWIDQPMLLGIFVLFGSCQICR